MSKEPGVRGRRAVPAFCPECLLRTLGQNVLTIYCQLSYLGFHILELNQPQMADIQEKNSGKFQKAKLEFAASWQLFT